MEVSGCKLVSAYEICLHEIWKAEMRQSPSSRPLMGCFRHEVFSSGITTVSWVMTSNCDGDSSGLNFLIQAF